MQREKSNKAFEILDEIREKRFPDVVDHHLLRAVLDLEQSRQFDKDLTQAALDLEKLVDNHLDVLDGKSD
jgi:hypothetical protein